MKLFKVKEGRMVGAWRIGFTDYYLQKLLDENGKWQGWWDIARVDGHNINVGEMFATRKDALDYFKRHGFKTVW